MPLRLVSENGEGGTGTGGNPAGPVLELAFSRLDMHGVPLFGPLSLTVRPGETVLVTGQDRGARAVLLRAACGLEPDLRGTLRLPRGVGAVLPDPALPRGPTPLETVMLCAPVDPVAAFAVLSEAGLSDQAEQPLSALSPLLHRCLHLACACAGGPGVLVLDGLFDDLSGRQAEVLMSIFAAMRAARGLAVVLTGQTTRALRPLANRVVTLDGRPAGIVSDIPNRPAPVMVTQTGR